MLRSREEKWRALGEQPLDLLIIGCGITGAGALRDAAHRGLRVAAVEMNDIASGTSSRSSKMIHGGLRYLKNLEFSLVFEAVTERRVLQDIAPHLIHPLGFLFPVYEGSKNTLSKVRAGLWVYDGLSLFRSPKLHRNLSRRQVLKEVPIMTQTGLKGAPLYWDCATDDARLTLETVLDAEERGADVFTYTRVQSLLRDDKGQVCGALVEDVLPGSNLGTLEVRAKVVVNATGPWTDGTRSMSSAGAQRQLLRPTKGVHIVVPASRLPVPHAVLCFHPVDGRPLYCVPWGDHTYVGTTDTDYEGRPQDVAANRADVDYLLETVRAYFPAQQIGDDDVVSTWAGLRPLIQPDDTLNESKVSREHEVYVEVDGLITIAGGKLTTYRRMGREVVGRALDLMMLKGDLPKGTRDPHTGREPLPGAVGWPADDDASVVEGQVTEACRGRLEPETVSHLVQRYGMVGIDIARYCVEDQARLEQLVPDRPEVMGLVDWAVTREFAQTITDVMVRRTRLHFRAPDQGLEVLDRVADRMALVLGWSAERKELEVAAYRAEVARSREWRTA